MEKNILRVEHLVGKPCWAIVGGLGNGSMLTIHVGERVPRRRPLPSGKERSEIQSFQGQYCIFVEGCAWRLQDGGLIVGGWSESEEEIEKNVKKLVGCIVTRIAFLTDSYDLLIEFSKRYILYLFCDRTILDDLNNYSIRSPEGWCIVKPRGKVEFERSEIKQR